MSDRPAQPNSPRVVPPPIIHDKAFQKALRTVRISLMSAFAVITTLLAGLGWTVYSFDTAEAKLPSILVAIISSGLLIGASWLGLRLAASHTMDVMMGIVAGGFLARVLIVFGTVVIAKTAGWDTRFIALGVVATVLATMVIEMTALSKAKVIPVEPLGQNVETQATQEG